MSRDVTEANESLASSVITACVGAETVTPMARQTGGSSPQFFLSEGNTRPMSGRSCTRRSKRLDEAEKVLESLRDW